MCYKIIPVPSNVHVVDLERKRAKKKESLIRERVLCTSDKELVLQLFDNIKCIYKWIQSTCHSLMYSLANCCGIGEIQTTSECAVMGK